MRSIRYPAAGEGGTSARRTVMIGGADSSSVTGIAVNTRLAKGAIVHCAGAIARRSECATQVNNVSADWLRSASLGSGKPWRLKSAPSSFSAFGVIEVVIHSASTSSLSEVARANGCFERHRTARRPAKSVSLRSVRASFVPDRGRHKSRRCRLEGPAQGSDRILQ